MKIFWLIITLLFIIFNVSCSSDDSQIVESFWVDSERVSCTGAFEQTCYKIQEKPIINENEWLLFYSPIEGFDKLYEEGYIYQLRVEKTKIDNPPQDGSSIKYKLKEILNKKLDE